MVGRTLLSAVSCGLFASLAVFEPLEASQQSPAPERGQNQTSAQGVEALQRAAEQGDVEAQYNLAFLYDEGRGVPQDDAEAVRWFRLAAGQGDAGAQNNLAFLYDGGRGVPPDDAEAVRWYRLAADQGHTVAQYNLGVMYAEGLGVPQDHVAAHMWLSLAAARSFANEWDTFVAKLDEVAAQMTPEQVVEAQHLAREWKPTDQP